MNRINKFSTKTQSSWSCTEKKHSLVQVCNRAIPAGKYFPPWKLSGAEVLEGVREVNSLKGHNNSAWGNALRGKGLRAGSPMTNAVGVNLCVRPMKIHNVINLINI